MFQLEIKSIKKWDIQNEKGSDSIMYCTCKKCNMKIPTPEEDPYNLEEDLEGCHN